MVDLKIERDKWDLTEGGERRRVICVDAPGGFPIITIADPLRGKWVMTSKQTLLEAVKKADGPLSKAEAILLTLQAVNAGVFSLCDDAAELFVSALMGNIEAFGACLALQEQLLPGWDYELGSCGPHMVKYRAAVLNEFPEGGGSPVQAVCRNAPTQALAWLIAIIEALIAREQSQ